MALTLVWAVVTDTDSSGELDVVRAAGLFVFGLAFGAGLWVPMVLALVGLCTVMLRTLPPDAALALRRVICAVGSAAGTVVALASISIIVDAGWPDVADLPGMFGWIAGAALIGASVPGSPRGRSTGASSSTFIRWSCP